MTNREFVELFIGYVSTKEGVIVNLFKDGRMRVTDYLQDGINSWFKAEDPDRVALAAMELCEINGWHPTLHLL